MGFTVLNALSICVKFNIWGRVLHSAAYCNFTRLCNTRCCSCNHSVKRLVCPGKGMEGGWLHQAGAFLALESFSIHRRVSRLDFLQERLREGLPACLLIQNVGADRRAFAYDQATFCANLMECGIPDFKGKERSSWQRHMGAGDGGLPLGAQRPAEF